MSVQIQEKIKIDYAILSNQGVGRKANHDSYGKFPSEHTNLGTQKGQLFVLSDSKSGNPGGRDAGKMSVRIIRENYFTYPSDDIAFCLQRAFDTANRHIYQYAQANNLHRKIGATCSALALTDKYAYVAHVGDCRVYRVSVRKIEKLTLDHTRTMEKISPTTGKRIRRTVLSRALGIRLGIKIDGVSKIPVHRDEYFVLCTDGLKYVKEEDIQRIVLSSTPKHACRKLVELARQRGGKDDTTVHVIKVYHHFPEMTTIETYSHIGEFSANRSNWPIYMMLAFLILMFITLQNKSLLTKFSNIIEYEPNEFTVTNAIQYDQLPEEINLEVRLADARENLKHDRLNQALKNFKLALAIDNQNQDALQGVQQIAEIRKKQGDRFYRKNDWANAAKYYELVLDIQPNNQIVQRQFAYCNRMLKSKKALAVRSKESRDYRLAKSESPPNANRSSVAYQAIQGISPAHWNMLGLDEGADYQIFSNNVNFSDNIRTKKAFHYQMYEGVEVEAAVTAQGLKKGRYGIIFGHETAGKQPYRHFYLFFVNGNGQYALVEVNDRQVNKLVSENIRPDFFAQHDKVYLKVKYFGKLILLYANGELLKMVPVDRPRKGGVGLYADPKLNVEFSNFKVAPAIYKQD